MQRIDLFGPIHKGLRAALCETATLLARTDFQDPAATRAATTSVAGLLGFLDEHARHEDGNVLPVLHQHSPELAAELRSDHARIEGLQEEVAAIAARLEIATPAERLSLGARLHERVWLLLAEHARHMQVEESRANRVLYANLSDEELAAIHGRIVGSIPPARIAEWMAILLPALSPAERAALEAAAGAKRPSSSGAKRPSSSGAKRPSSSGAKRPSSSGAAR